MIRIKSKQKNFRRCGIPHPDTPVDYPDNRFTPAELAILKAEPMLIVEVIVPAKKPASDEGKDIAEMTVAQLTAEIINFQPSDTLKGLKKAELVEILKTYREAGPKA